MNIKSATVFLVAVMVGLTQVHAQPPPQVAAKPQTQAAIRTQTKVQTQTRAAQMAAADDAYYAYIPWRSNDPFVFCKYGPPPSHCWKPIDPISATWVPTCLPYTQPNMTSVAYYVQVCPQAEESGEWVPDNDGTPTTTPFVH